jgi:hypothetical protein
MAFDPLSEFQTQSCLQTIQYEGPSKPKQRSQQPHKISSYAEQEEEEGLTVTSDGVELVNLTFLGGHPNSRRSNIRVCSRNLSDDGVKGGAWDWLALEDIMLRCTSELEAKK